MVQATAAFSISRRAILGAAATVPAMSIPVVSIDPDAPLFGLARKIEALNEKSMPVWDALFAAENEMKRWHMANPKPVMDRPLDADGQTDESQIDASAARWVAAMRVWGDARRDATKVVKLAEKMAAHEACRAEINVLIGQVSEIPATTLAGLRCKATLTYHALGSGLQDSILNDLLDLQAAA